MQINNINANNNFGAIKYTKYMRQGARNFIQKNVLPKFDTNTLDAIDRQGYDIYFNVLNKQCTDVPENVTVDIFDKIEGRSYRNYTIPIESSCDSRPLYEPGYFTGGLEKGLAKLNAYLSDIFF